MSKIIIIGAGGVGNVVTQKCAREKETFSEILLASRTKSKCDAIANAIGANRIQTAKVDADNVQELVALFNDFKPDMVINVALPYQDLTIMDACLEQVFIILTLLIMSLLMKQNLNISGNGTIKRGLKMQELWHYWVADLIRA